MGQGRAWEDLPADRGGGEGPCCSCWESRGWGQGGAGETRKGPGLEGARFSIWGQVKAWADVLGEPQTRQWGLGDRSWYLLLLSI